MFLNLLSPIKVKEAVLNTVRFQIFLLHDIQR